MNRSFPILFMLFLAGQFACVPFEEERLTDINLNYQDALFQELYNLQDRQLSDSIYRFFHHKDPTYRYTAALAFASIKDPGAIDSLAVLLQDQVDEVKAAAAYALGQIGKEAAESMLISAFNQYDTSGNFKRSNRAILEAVGRCGGALHLQSLSTINTYRSKDTALLEGQAWGIYRYALRDITSKEGTARMVEFVGNKSYPANVRFIAANYLSRSQNIDLSGHVDLIIPAFRDESDARIRMALAIALGKAPSPESREALLQQYREEEDYRVKCNILRSLGNFEYKNVQELVFAAAKDPNLHVAHRAAQYFLENGIQEDARTYWRNFRGDTIPWQVQITMYQAANRHLPPNAAESRDGINAELRQRFRRSSNPYEKAAALAALSEFGWNLRFIQRESYPSESYVVKTAGVSSLRGISDDPDFRDFFGESRRRIRSELASYFKEAIESGDPGMIAIGAAALRNDQHSYRGFLDSLNFLETALGQLRLPKDIEAYIELKKTVDYFAGQTGESPSPRPDFNHPIQWNLLQNLKPESRAVINTSRGNIRIQLLPNLAPGTVANFLDLVQQGYYNGKNFHRVVPNFVIQGGCSRGDGYGSEPFTIRSELPPLHYDREGYVGMASAGNHTESTQFFITNSPTPHLDGNYTIFARVTNGMEVVHHIQVGDIIQSIEIQ